MNDLRHAFRQLRRNPGFALAALLTLTVGIGAAATIFSLVNGVLLRPPPGESPEELVRVYTSHSEGFQYGSLSYPDYEDLRADEALRDLALFRPISVAVGEGAGAERVWGQITTSNFFSLLGIQPALGRGFRPEEDEPGAGAVVVLAHDFWVRHFQGDPGAVGRTLVVNGQSFTVVGVAPEGFQGVQLGLDSELFAPMGMAHVLRPGVDIREQRGSRSFLATGRLAPGMTARTASDALSIRMDRLAELYPGTNEGRGVLALPESEVGLSPDMRGTTVGAAVLFLAAGGLLLLLATVNVSTLLLARARARRKETGIRMALGASAARLVRQHALESLLLCFVAGGIALAWSARLAGVLSRVRLPIEVPLLLDFPVDARVVAGTLAIATVIAVAVAIAPALRTARMDVTGAIRGSGEGRRSQSEGRAGRALVVVQLALSLALLVGAGAFLRAAWESSRTPLPFEVDRHLLATVDPGLFGYDEEEGAALYRSLLERVRALPSVRAASLGEMLPVGLMGQQWGVEVDGYEPAPGEDMIVDYNVVGAGYFDALGAQILEGRDFGEEDDADAEPVAIVNEVMARRYWPEGDALGGTVHAAGAMRRVVGIAPALHLPVLDPDPGPYVWVPHGQFYNSAMVVHARTEGPPRAAVPEVRRALSEVAAAVPVLEVQTMEEHVGVGLLPLRAGTLVFGLLGGLGLVLAVVGLYGVLAFHVARRTREIGIRMALGASKATVVRLVLRQGAALVGLGFAVGLPVALLISFGASRILEGARMGDPAVYGSVVLVLAGVGLLAAWIPARRAAAVEPAITLREE